MSAAALAYVPSLSLANQSPNSLLLSATATPAASVPSTTQTIPSASATSHIFSFQVQSPASGAISICLSQEKIAELVQSVINELNKTGPQGALKSYDAIAKITTELVRTAHKKKNFTKDLTIETLNEIIKEVAMQALKKIDPQATPNGMLAAISEGQLTNRVSELNHTHYQEVVEQAMSPKATAKPTQQKREESGAVNVDVKSDHPERTREDTPPPKDKKKCLKSSQVYLASNALKHKDAPRHGASGPKEADELQPARQNAFSSSEKAQNKKSCTDICCIM